MLRRLRRGLHTMADMPFFSARALPPGSILRKKTRLPLWAVLQ